MSEYMEKHAVSKLIGSPPGYVGHEEGGQLTERVRRNPYSVVLLDEIEKAHPDIANILLQILEDGILTDSLGNQVDFRNTLIIMTSQPRHALPGHEGPHGLPREDERGRSEVSAEQMIHQELKREFSPEFINRIDDIIIFNPLTQIELRADLPPAGRRRQHGAGARRACRSPSTTPWSTGCWTRPPRKRTPEPVRCAAPSSATSRTSCRST